MNAVTLAEAKAHPSELVERAAGGKTVRTRQGKPIAMITPMEAPRKRVDVDMLRAITERTQPQAESADEFMRRMRDEDRY